MKRTVFTRITFRAISVVVLIAFVAAGAFKVGFWMGTGQLAAVASAAPSQQGTTEANVPGFPVFWEAWNYVEQQFYGQVPAAQQRVYGAIRGMVNSYGDQNTAFLDPTQAAIFQQDVSGSFEGIGAVVRLDDMNRVTIAQAYPGRPAAAAGLLGGDVIVAVNGQSLDGMSLYDVISLIRGPAGTRVTLSILRQGETRPFDVVVTRAHIDIQVVTSKRLDGDIGYVSLSEFSRGASQKLTDAIRGLEAQGPLKGLVFDLRNNPGGLLDEGVSVASQFIDQGTITLEREKGGQQTVFNAQPGGVALQVPLAVLVNAGSASASEIVTGAIRDHHRGELVGERTFGKGTVQIPHTLSDGSELRVTIAEWLTPNGDEINHQGITPDIVVPMTQADFAAGKDPQLDRAVQYLTEGK